MARTAQLAAVLVAGALAQGPGELFTLVSLANHSGAVCLDGTPGGFYIHPGRLDRWVVWHEGGGWCQDTPTCAARAATRLGSSSTWTPNASFQGILNADAGWNPDFFDATLVYAKYCDGSSFASAGPPVPVNATYSLQRGGAAIHSALMYELVHTFGLGSAPGETLLVVSGSSAGGLSTYMHVDAMAAYVNASVTGGGSVRTVGMPDAGWFLEGPAFNPPGAEPWVPMLQGVQQWHNITTAAQMDAGCWAATPAASLWQCLWARYSAPHTQTPLFVLNSHLDWVQLGAILGLPQACVDAPFTNCTADELTAMEGWRLLWDASLNATLAAAPALRERGGSFVASCIQHEEGYVDRRWSNDTVAGYTMRDAFGGWVSGAPPPAAVGSWFLVDPAPVGGNPSCQPPGP